MDLNKRKLELMKEKRVNNNVDVVNRYNILVMLDAKYKSLIKEGKTDKDALVDASVKINKDLLKERDSALEFGAGDYVNKIDIQLDELSKFMPKNLSEDEVAEIVNKVVNDVEDKNMGKIMGVLNKELKGKADMSLVSKLVRESLN